MKKRIGITQRILEASPYSELREGLALDWGKFFRTQGQLAVPLSYEEDFDSYRPYLDGVILSGGNDLNALKPSPINEMRDHYEKKIIQDCIKMRIPLLGICRGAQILAEYFGADFERVEGHVGEHSILFEDGRMSGEFRVNSYHNFAIKQLDPHLRILGKSKDSIEAFMHPNLPILAVMWHIEREDSLSRISAYIYQRFLDFIEDAHAEY